MWKPSASTVTAAARLSPARRWLSSAAYIVNGALLGSLEEHRREISKVALPLKKVRPPPRPYVLVKGAQDRSEGPVLWRTYEDEKITISVVRRALAIPSRSSGDQGGDFISELLLHVDVSKPVRDDSLLFLCGIHPDGAGIHSICLFPKLTPSVHQGRVFLELDRKLRNAFSIYLEERGVNGSLFQFLQPWLYTRDFRNLMHWFDGVSTFLKN